MADETSHPNNSQIVSDKGSSKLSDLWKLEDYWSIWLGFIILIIALIIYIPKISDEEKEVIDKSNSTLLDESQRAPFKTIEWYKALDQKEKLKAASSQIGKDIKKITSKPKSWETNFLDAFFISDAEAQERRQVAEIKYQTAKQKSDELLEYASATQSAAELDGFRDKMLNEKTAAAIGQWRKALTAANKAKEKTKVSSFNILPSLIINMLIIAIFFGVGMKVMGHSLRKFVLGFTLVFGIAVLAYLFEGQVTMNHYGIGYAAWAILFGLIISNTIGTPGWVKPAVQTEFYIKTGLVLLGAEILFGKILTIGIPGIFVAWLVTPIVLMTSYWVGNRFFKLPSKTLNVTISAAVSVCGVSAAIATAAACKAKKEELTLAVGLSLIFTALMMILMPPIIKAVGMPHILGGAWMGGTIDSTGAVAAAGAFLSDRALYVAATIKMIQNILIGMVAFFVAIYWVAKVDRKAGQKVSAMEIWYRFPKFVIGFVAASIMFSVIYQFLGQDISYVVIDNGSIQGMSKIFRGWFFCLAFVSIGLATDFRELKSYFKGGKPFIHYIFGQTFNLILTLLIAYLMFYVFFSEITALI